MNVGLFRWNTLVCSTEIKALWMECRTLLAEYRALLDECRALSDEYRAFLA